MKKLFHLLFGAALLVLAGCAAAPTLTPPSSQDPIVVYHRSGGLAGVDETWSIYADGRVQYAGRGTGSAGQLTADQLSSLSAALRSIDLTTIKDSYIGTDTCCDRFIYELTLNLDGQTKSIKTIDAAQGEPAALTTLLNAIRAVTH